MKIKFTLKTGSYGSSYQKKFHCDLIAALFILNIDNSFLSIFISNFVENLQHFENVRIPPPQTPLPFFADVFHGRPLKSKEVTVVKEFEQFKIFLNEFLHKYPDQLPTKGYTAYNRTKLLYWNLWSSGVFFSADSESPHVTQG